ncbi:MAG: formylglycine-generating enzyme family protein [Verrucomicrobiae bacterium]|nr:formylglycine-generating enzyme family protein [Verrucomicrobiae bacterium]
MKPLKRLLPSIQQGWVRHLTLFSLAFSLGWSLNATAQVKDDLELVKRIREKILATAQVDTEEAMADYENKIPDSGVPYQMVAIKGGEFLMGSPPDEPGRNPDEGPQRKVSVKPFWMGKYEVTWDQFEPFMITDFSRNPDGSLKQMSPDYPLHYAVSMPTTPYMDMSFGMGRWDHPAICMTQHAASKYCEWLSAQTGHYYRLPTEAEWEYACRAGTTTAYSFGNDLSKLGEYAVYDPDLVRTEYAKVGTKKPNPWGLYDMHGNVMEWCLDQYFVDAYRGKRKTVPATTLYPRVARGGSWYDTAELLRSAARTRSTLDWKMQDPQLPKSIWYHTDASWLGFRIVRPLENPSAEEMDRLWNSAAGLTDPRP